MGHKVIVVSLFMVSCLWAPISHATLLMLKADVTSDISFLNPNDFNGAQLHVNHTVTQSAASTGDSGAYTFNFTGGPPFNVTVTGDSHIAISGVGVSATQTTFTRTSTDSLTGQFQLDFYRNPTLGSRFETGVIGGVNVLQYQLDPGWALVSGSPFTFEIVISGTGPRPDLHQVIIPF